ncbi:hypothetical protein C2S52_003352 [Perilla frutescens var. hirtella]|nr:hypothetical protein C2S51_012148 [Perilla frutescens var. frutescens]KAH6792875.1 hypothetical protein C2S52_003352 [Perilla frutescens var. hirtella]
MFSVEVENVKEDLMNLEKLYGRVQDSNEDIKNAEDAKTMREVRSRLNGDLDHLFKVAKQINKKFDALIRANAAQRKGSSDDDHRASMISDLVDALQYMMRRFQTLRTQMEADHRQQIEAKFYAITREKATAESIDNLIASEATGSPLHHAIQELGRDPVAEAVAEIQERRDAMREVRRNLMALHQVLLGIATPLAAVQQQPPAGGDLPSPVETSQAPPPAAAFAGGKGGGAGGLNDYERETRNQAYIAIVIALIIVIGLIISILKVDIKLETDPEAIG